MLDDVTDFTSDTKVLTKHGWLFFFTKTNAASQIFNVTPSLHIDSPYSEKIPSIGHGQTISNDISETFVQIRLQICVDTFRCDNISLGHLELPFE